MMEAGEGVCEGEAAAAGQAVGGEDLGLVAGLGRVDADEKPALYEKASLL